MGAQTRGRGPRHALLALGLAGCAVSAWPDDTEHREFADFIARPLRAGPAESRTAPPTPLEWKRLVTPAASYEAPRLAPQDADLLTLARNGRWAQALTVVKSGQAQPNATDELHGNVLVLAVRAGQDELVRELLQRGADPDRVGEDGFTPLGAAAFAGNTFALRLLLKYGADLKAWGATGMNALHWAIVGGQQGAVDVLLRAGADPFWLTRSGDHALDVAAANGQLAVMQHLIAMGADPATGTYTPLAR